MAVVVVTGSCGLVGSEVVRLFCRKGYAVVGIDNNMRQHFFGEGASTAGTREVLKQNFGKNYIHREADIRDTDDISRIFKEYGSDIALVVHTAAQPSHDWASSDPIMDFQINAFGTLALLESCRQNCPDSTFIFCSTNKVYGDTPNLLPCVEHETRWELEPSHRFYPGIDESMSIDNCLHSLFGASKVSADVLVQEYGRYFGMKTAVFRAGCLTGENHAGARLHGFLSYLVRCAITNTEYTIYGYKGKQVRDNLHSEDLANAFYCFYKQPRVAEIYNIGGGRNGSCSVLEAIAVTEKLTGKRIRYSVDDRARIGDHRWWISDTRKFSSHYPSWKISHGLEDIIGLIFSSNAGKWTQKSA